MRFNYHPLTYAVGSPEKQKLKEEFVQIFLCRESATISHLVIPAIALQKKALQRAPNDLLTHVTPTTVYSWAGGLEEARAQAAEVLRINPKFSVDYFSKTAKYKKQENKELLFSGLRKAGLK